MISRAISFSKGCPSSKGSVRFTSAAAPCPPCASSSTRTPYPNMASGLRTCARRLLPPTPTAQRERLRMANGTFKSTPTTKRRSAADYTPLIIAYRNGARCVSPTSPKSWIPSRMCATLALPTASRRFSRSSFRQPGANIIDTVDRVKAELPHLQAAMPSDIEITRARRPQQHHPRLLARHRTDPGHRDSLGHADRFFVPARCARGDHSKRRRAGFASSAPSPRCIS